MFHQSARFWWLNEDLASLRLSLAVVIAAQLAIAVVGLRSGIRSKSTLGIVTCAFAKVAALVAPVAFYLAAVLGTGLVAG